VTSAGTRLTALRDALATLFDVIESEASDSRVSQGWKVCERCYDALGDISEFAANLDSEGRELAQEVLRLDALVRESIVRQQGSIREALRLTREARRSSAFYVPEGRTGRGCDVAG